MTAMSHLTGQAQVSAALARAQAIEDDRARELRVHRRFGAGVGVTVGAFVVLVGVLTSPVFRPPTQITPVLPWAWSLVVAAAGLCLVLGLALRRRVLAIVGAYAVAGWAWTLAALAWASIAYPTTGDPVSWWPTPLYGLIGTVAVLIGRWLTALRPAHRHES